MDNKNGSIETARGFILGVVGLIIIGIVIIFIVNSMVDSTSSSNSYVYNQTWLEFDGVNDYVLISSDIIDSISFWYANETSEWIFITNSSGTLYVNAVEESPLQYPIYHNGSAYFLGMYNETSYFNGSIDDFRIYEKELNITEIEDIYGNGK